MPPNYDTRLTFILKYLRSEMEALQLSPQYNDEIDSELCGLCALSAGRTQHILSQLGYKVQSVASLSTWASHCYCVVDDNIIVDLTATQFDENEIYIATYNPLLNDNSPWYQSNRLLFDDHKELYEHLSSIGWTKYLLYNDKTEVKIRDICAQIGVKFIDDNFVNSVLKFYKTGKELSLGS